MQLPTIRYALDRTREADSTIPIHLHQTWELVYYLSGSGQSRIGDTVYSYSAGNVCLVPPEVGHSEVISEQTHVVFCTFDCPEDGIDCRGGMYSGDEESVALIQHISKIKYLRDDVEATVASLYLSIILTRLAAQSGLEGAAAPSDGRSLESACQYIHEYYNTNIDLPELAATVGYSYDRFRHIFRERYGIPPKQMILYKRLSAAKNLLRGDGKITNIARQCGFSSASQFNATFRRTQGMTPSEYRRRDRAT